ncbi:response regulator [Caballeronia sp. BR00000012568055]|uniref:response regulator n=1 Tax=Caballeronia sp. BR00000012568055 TaxID=2918761 RepID=UPI0023F9B107|nr:response regulator [Caballeronia sp. BR00000012568055]
MPDEIRKHDLNESGGLEAAISAYVAGTMLLADDNSDMRDCVRRLLEEHGLTVIPVADGEEALVTLSEKSVDLLPTDVMMPRLNGFELVADLRADPRLVTQPIIMLSAQAGARIDTAYSAVERGGRLASQLLSFARRHPIAPVVVNLGKLIKSFDELLRHAMGETTEVVLFHASDLWNTRIDRAHMENALLNLAINARDAMTSAGTLTITVENATIENAQPQLDGPGNGQYVRLSVSDTGSGMPPHVKARVFEPFYSTKPEGKGTGLGMSMVYGYVRQAGGFISIDSEIGQGSTITIWLPAVFDEESPLVRDLEESPTGNGERVLVVEDDASVRRTVTDMLRTIGYETIEAEHADAAAQLLRAGVIIDLLFTDVVMPGKMTSSELAALARRTHPHVGILFTSGYAENRIAHGGLLDAGVQLLSKPYASSTLARRLRQVFSSAQSNMSLTTSVVKDALEQTRSPARILFVEDDDNLRDATIALLSTLPVQVTACPDAEAAAQAFDTPEAFDMLVTDVSLSKMSGIELARALRNVRADLPVIFITGHELNEMGDGMHNAQIIRKPFDISLLEQAINRFVGATG